jgi:acyl carrier protein
MIAKNFVKEKIAGVLRLPPEQIEDDALLTDLAAESFVLVEMVIELQEDLGVRVVQDDLKGVKTVADLIKLFDKHPN